MGLLGLVMIAKGTGNSEPLPLIVVIDSGIASEHPVFHDRFLALEEIETILPEAFRGVPGKHWTGWDFVDGDADPQDRTGQGSHSRRERERTEKMIGMPGAGWAAR
jgi:hypothetical protein